MAQTARVSRVEDMIMLLQMACASPGQRPSCGWLSSPEGVVLVVGGEGRLVAEVEVEVEVEVESRVVDTRV